MTDQRSASGRTYQMRKRAEDVADTRRRIVEAAVRLHGTVGPAATTIAALADEAGVTRLTVYRHFPDDLGLFTACSRHWGSAQVFPEPAVWSEIADAGTRLTTGFADLYRFYRDAEPMLTNVRRDRAVLPAEILEHTAATDELYVSALADGFALRGSRRRRTRAVVGHAVSFWTWRSLCVDQGLANAEATSAMVALVLATAEPSQSG